MKKTDIAAVPVEFETIPAWEKRTGMKSGATYAHLADGKLRAIKIGRRTMIDVLHGLDYLKSNKWRPSGPAAKRGAGR